MRRLVGVGLQARAGQLAVHGCERQPGVGARALDVIAAPPALLVAAGVAAPGASARAKIEMSATPGSPGAGAPPRPSQQQKRPGCSTTKVSVKPWRWALSEFRSKVSSPPGRPQAGHRRHGGGEVIVAEEVVQRVVEARDPVERPERARQRAHVGPVQRGVGERGAGALRACRRRGRSRRRRSRGGRAGEALAGPARHVEDAAPGKPVLERQPLQALQPHVMLVVSGERVVVGRERRVGTLGTGSRHAVKSG